MKKIFTSLAMLAFAGISFGQVITQSSDPVTISPTGSAACGVKDQQTGTLLYTSDNYYSRAFKLSDYAINYDFRIKKVEFGVQKAQAGTNSTVDLTVNIYKQNGANYPGGTQSLLASSTVSVTDADNLTLVNTGNNLETVVPNGSTFVMEVFHDGTDDESIFYIGSNSAAETKPSYLKSDGCGLLTPVTTGSINFADMHLVFSVTGENALGVTEVLNARDLQIYPNPVKDVLNFKLANGLQVESVALYDMTGKKVNMVSAKASNSINVANFPKGNYVLKVKANDGKVYVQKVLKN